MGIYFLRYHLPVSPYFTWLSDGSYLRSWSTYVDNVEQRKRTIYGIYIECKLNH